MEGHGSYYNVYLIEKNKEHEMETRDCVGIYRGMLNNMCYMIGEYSGNAASTVFLKPLQPISERNPYNRPKGVSKGGALWQILLI